MLTVLRCVHNLVESSQKKTELLLGYSDIVISAEAFEKDLDK
jgi:hypothetical protein